jgi:FSR family fosmidomycin resistance protein-like MFS transporter
MNATPRAWAYRPTIKVRASQSHLPSKPAMGVWTSSHATVDFFQGVVAVSAPLFVLERGFDYAATAGLVAAAAIGAALPQIPIGLVADRRPISWAPAVGVALAAVGTAVAGLLHSYLYVLAVLLVAGFGAALYHPVAGRDARLAAGNSATAMGMFAAGGSVGALGAPLLAAPLLAMAGLTALAWCIPPGILVAIVLTRSQRRTSGRDVPVPQQTTAGADRPQQFALLILVEIARCAASLGVSTFLALYCMRQFGTSTGFGQGALMLYLGGAVMGTSLGGRLGDRIGSIRVLQVGNVGLCLALAALVLAPDHRFVAAAALIVGVFAGLPFANLIKLGQDYLPNRRGTAAGLLFGFAVSIGGLLMPALGALADHSGPRAALANLIVLPAVAVALSILLRSTGTVPVTHRAEERTS